MDKLQSIKLPAVKNPFVLTCFLSLVHFMSYGQYLKNNYQQYYTRITGGTALAFYKGDNNYMANLRAGHTYYVQVAEELRLKKDFFIVPGVEYMNYSLSFNSYYVPGPYFLYKNSTYNHNYSMSFQDIRLNLMLRYTDGQETRKPISFYAEAGYLLRYLIHTNLKVVSSDDGSVKYDGTAQTPFEHYILYNKLSPSLKLNAGIQHNFLRTHRAWYIQLSYIYDISGINLQQNFTPTSLYVRSSFLQFGLGIKF